MTRLLLVIIAGMIMVAPVCLKAEYEEEDSERRIETGGFIAGQIAHAPLNKIQC